MGQITRTYRFSRGVDLSPDQVESEIFNIVNTWNNTDNGILTWNHVNLGPAKRITFNSSDGTKQTLMGYVINQFQIFADSGDGIVLVGNSAITKSFNPTYGGGSGVLFIGDAQTAPSSTPTNGLILYSSAGSLVYIDESGDVIKLNGETVTSGNVGPTSFPATTQYGDLTSISLTKGKWSISAVMNAVINPATQTVTTVNLGISTTTGNSLTGLNDGDNLITDGLQGSGATMGNISMCIASYVLTLASTTTVYMKYRSVYSVGTPSATGRISAIRIQ